jgi:hypothetical protein
MAAKTRAAIIFFGILALAAFPVAFQQYRLGTGLLLEAPEDATHGSRVKTAVVMRCVAPIRPATLDKVYRLASELSMSGYPYDFWLLVDDTNNNHTNERLGNFFAKHGGHVEAPKVFPVSEKKILEAYPNLTSYIYNTPEPNFDNSPRSCCDKPIMWQLLAPAFAVFMAETRYDFGWVVEDDFSSHGQLTILELMREWDLKLGPDVDLAAEEVLLPLDTKHTNGFALIVQDMVNSSVKWRVYADHIQRHSLAMADAISEELSRNVMQFAERFVYPIAWKHNMTVVDLKEVSLNYSVFGWGDREADYKVSSSDAFEYLLKTTATPATYVFHEELPKS